MFKRLRRLLRIQPLQPREDEKTLLLAIENAVDRTDPRIRLISGYRKKLRAAVTHSLNYANEIVAQVPGPIEVTSNTFSVDHHVHAFFLSVEQLQRVFSLSRDARKFFEAPENRERDTCYGLLVMDKRERRTLGAELKGDIIHKEVPQVSVSFSEHRILASVATDADLRHSITNRVFKDLIACAVEKILSVQVQRQALQDQRNRLKLQLRMLESRTQGLEDGLEEVEFEDEAKITAIRQRLTQIEQALRGQELGIATARFSTLEDYIALINTVLGNPDEYFRLRQESIRINRLGIKTNPDSCQRSYEIPFAAVELGTRLRCVTIMVKYSRHDMLPVDHYLKKALLT